MKNRDEQKVYKNVSYLSILQMFNYLLPLLTMPYLVRVLNAEMFGLVAFSQAFIQYFIIIVDFGFNLSATKDVSIYRSNKEKLSEIVSSVLIIKMSLLLVFFVVLCGMVFSIDKFRSYYLIHLYTYGMVVGNALFPVWFFQGQERMQYITILNVVAKTIFTLLIFLVVRVETDYLLVPLFNSLGQFIIGSVSLYIIFTKFDIVFFIPKVTVLKGYLVDSFHLFLSRACLSLYTVANTVLLGFVTTNEVTGYYAVAEKLVRAMEGLVQPLTDAVYPYMARTRNKAFIKKMIKRATAITVLMVAVVFIVSDSLFGLVFGHAFLHSSYLFKLFLLEVLVTIPSALLGLPLLVAFGHYKWFNGSNIIGFIFYLISLAMIYREFNVVSLIIVTVLSQVIVLCHRSYGVYKFKLW
ncbi:putative membrane protein [Propionispora sp. 2/2-37]|uniref:oligosaccharide flippase family protein n=1 Tax=Propionispora sp. 2/2-37 TaxID=1677858 RepID=UPI0006BB77B8|nr:oligosaccharide flippase family protein [Propionispora sp. 2/2-37]CUH94475.1 putative membrane protein [Propionispora sp. 2/2-37]